LSWFDTFFKQNLRFESFEKTEKVSHGVSSATQIYFLKSKFLKVTPNIQVNTPLGNVPSIIAQKSQYLKEGKSQFKITQIYAIEIKCISLIKYNSV
jgi:hypothetical protein